MIRIFDMPPANIAFATLGALLFVSPSLFGRMGETGDAANSIESALAIGIGALLLLVGVLGHRFAQTRRDLAVGAIAVVLVAVPPLLGFGLLRPLYRVDLAIAVLLVLTSAIDIWKRRTGGPHAPTGTSSQ